MKYARPLILALPLIVGACASKPESDPAYVSPTQYDTYSCDQMRAEMVRVSSQIDQETKSAESNKVADVALKAFALYQGYGYSDEQSVELRRAKAKYQILDEMMIKKNCTN